MMRRRTILFMGTALLVGEAAMWAQTPSGSPRRYVLPDEPAQAWAEVDKVHQTLKAPDAWQTNTPSPAEITRFQKEIREKAWSFAERAQEFIERFPTNENLTDARITVVHSLTYAVAAGDTNAEHQVSTYVASMLGDRRIPEDDRAVVLLFAGNVTPMKKAGMRVFTEGMAKLHDEFEASALISMKIALKHFPTNALLYTMLVSAAQGASGEQQKAMANEILKAEGAPAGAKTLAQHILKGTRPYRLGAPVEIRFTALDGQEVDLANLKGKVVLVNFWSTTCGPCLAELPALKAAYERWHPQGFEIVGIALDDKEGPLRRFIKEKGLAWPQHFDGKGWGSQFAMKYGVFSIPTMWLVDRQGNLRDVNARGNLEDRIQALLNDSAGPARVTK